MKIAVASLVEARIEISSCLAILSAICIVASLVEARIEIALLSNFVTCEVSRFPRGSED